MEQQSEVIVLGSDKGHAHSSMWARGWCSGPCFHAEVAVPLHCPVCLDPLSQVPARGLEWAFLVNDFCWEHAELGPCVHTASPGPPAPVQELGVSSLPGRTPAQAPAVLWGLLLSVSLSHKEEFCLLHLKVSS